MRLCRDVVGVRGAGTLRPLAVVVVLALAGGARADVVTLTNGKTLEGKVTEQTDAEVVIETTFDGVKRVPKAEVKTVDKSTPPLRAQLAFRLEQAGTDPAKLWEVHGWAKGAGFKDELKDLLEQIIRQSPDDARARKLLGHEKVDGKWLTPADKAAHEKEKKEAELRAKGLVPYGEEWVTPKEKEAREKGLMKDGEDWVTEEQYHQRRGEQRVDGKWVRVGEKEGKGYAADAGNAARVTLVAHWGAHFDVLSELDGPVSQRVVEGLEKAYSALRRALSPESADMPETLERRVRVALFKKAPAFSRFAEWFGGKNKIDAQQPGWSKSVPRQPAFWWVDPDPMVAVYQHPNIEKTVVSNAVHNAGLILLTQYRFNWAFPSPWLREGFAYHLEMQSLGYSLSFTLGRAGGTSQGGSDTAPPWAESEKWKIALKTAVAGGTDPPLKRLAAMTPDQMGYPELVKSWSIVDYLVQWDRAKFKAFVDGTKADLDAPTRARFDADKDGRLDDKERVPVEEEALSKATGMTYKQLDDKWRAWVTAGFGKP